MFTAGISATASEISRLANQVVVRTKFAAQSRIDVTAPMVANVVSVSREILSCFSPLMKGPADSTIASVDGHSL